MYIHTISHGGIEYRYEWLNPWFSRVKGRTRLVIEEVEVTSPKIKTSRGKPSSDAASRKEERRSRRSSTFVTSLAMQLQPISLEDEDNQDA